MRLLLHLAFKALPRSFFGSLVLCSRQCLLGYFFCFAGCVGPPFTLPAQRYEQALSFLLERIAADGTAAVMIATHNQASIAHAVQTMESLGLDRGHPAVHFGQILGITDNLSVALGLSGYNAMKLVLFGDFNEVFPWLIRRLDENRDMLGAAQQGQLTTHDNIAPPLFKMACKQNLDLRCVLISDPNTLGAGAKTRLKSQGEEVYATLHLQAPLVTMPLVTPPCICRASSYHALSYATLHLQGGPFSLARPNAACSGDARKQNTVLLPQRRTFFKESTVMGRTANADTRHTATEGAGQHPDLRRAPTTERDEAAPLGRLPHIFSC